jgi:hypothetical protein
VAGLATGGGWGEGGWGGGGVAMMGDAATVTAAWAVRR